MSEPVPDAPQPLPEAPPPPVPEPEPTPAASEPVTEPEPEPAPEPVQFAADEQDATPVTLGVSNASPQMPPNAQATAAKAHALLGHISGVAATLRAEIERYVPAPVLQAAEVEVAAMIRAIL